MVSDYSFSRRLEASAITALPLSLHLTSPSPQLYGLTHGITLHPPYSWTWIPPLLDIPTLTRREQKGQPSQMQKSRMMLRSVRVDLGIGICRTQTWAHPGVIRLCLPQRIWRLPTQCLRWWQTRQSSLRGFQRVSCLQDTDGWAEVPLSVKKEKQVRFESMWLPTPKCLRPPRDTSL